MKELNPQKIFVQYRYPIMPYDPIQNRRYTITHSDRTADLFVTIAEDYAQDQVTKMRDEVLLEWMQNGNMWYLIGSVLVDGDGVPGNPDIRYPIFYREMPTALQALRQADRFLFEHYPFLDSAPVIIKFNSSKPEYDKIYNFGSIGSYPYDYEAVTLQF